MLDATLYALCHENPHHHSVDVIHAKLWIIGRTFASGIERQIAADGLQGSALTTLSNHLFVIRQEMDAALAELAALRPPLTAASLHTIMSVHGRIATNLSAAVTTEHSPRSFVSKYLHFHCPLVPMYDAFATTALTRYGRFGQHMEVAPRPNPCDDDYCNHAFKFFHLYTQLQELGGAPTVRHLDHHLLCEAARLVTWKQRARHQP